ncbi:MAG TPA: outer membrane beta-barrel protein, partial [Ferruginibacter sp.]|nr:outer membrane beta-barrel protein [Ferruginibacter sp.]
DKQLNTGFSKTTTTTEGNNMNNTLLYRHKFGKKGRTISLNGTTQYNNSSGSSALNSINNYYSNGIISQRDTINQVLSVKSITSSYGGMLTYTEPLSKRSLLEIRGFYNKNNGELNRKTFDYNATTGKHDLVDPSLSIAFENDYNYGGGGAGIRVLQKKYNFSAGANVQQTTLTSRLTDSVFSVKQSYLDVLPNALFVYNFTRMKNIRFEYTSATTAPTAAQLQPVTDVSNPLYIRKGNPLLKQEYDHTLSLQFFNANPAKRQNMFAFINYSNTKNAIVTSDFITSSGIRTSTPVNSDGVYNLMATAERGFSVNPLNTRFGLGGNINYNHTVNFINGQENNTGNLSLTPRVSANFAYQEKIDISLIARYTYNQAKYSLQPVLNDNYGIMRYELDATFNLPAGFSLVNQISFSSYSGRSDGFNNSYTIWNASISKPVFKSKKGEIKFSATDLLKQQNGIDRVANTNYIEDASYQSLKQYFTLGFSYSLQKAVTGGPRAVIRTF